MSTAIFTGVYEVDTRYSDAAKIYLRRLTVASLLSGHFPSF